MHKTLNTQTGRHVWRNPVKISVWHLDSAKERRRDLNRKLLKREPSREDEEYAREGILHKVIPVNLFIDIVPSSSMGHVTRRVAKKESNKSDFLSLFSHSFPTFLFYSLSLTFDFSIYQQKAFVTISCWTGPSTSYPRASPTEKRKLRNKKDWLIHWLICVKPFGPRDQNSRHGVSFF